MKRWLPTLLLVAAGCSDSAGPEAAHYGRYTLHRINDNLVPAIFTENANGRLEFLSGALRLNRDSTFTDSTEVRVTPMFQGQPLEGGEVQHRFDVAWGLWNLSGDTVYLRSIRGERYFMIIQASGTLTQELGGALLQYRK